MRTGTQFSGSLGPRASRRWFTHGWPAAWHVVWYVTPTTPQSGSPQLEWTVSVERASPTQCTYWINVKNLTLRTVAFEARYAILAGEE